MKFRDDFLTILAVSSNQENLTLRLDSSDWFQLNSYKEQVLELQLIKCENTDEGFEKINSLVGEIVWNFEFSESEKLFSILMEDASEIEIKCEKLLDKRSDLTIDELFSKFQWLETAYQRESEEGGKGWSKYHRLSGLLKFELTNDLDKWKWRKNFFEQNNSNNTEKAEAVIKFGNKILNFIGQIDAETK